jgi:hypothetical protein
MYSAVPGIFPALAPSVLCFRNFDVAFAPKDSPLMSQIHRYLNSVAADQTAPYHSMSNLCMMPLIQHLSFFPAAVLDDQGYCS